ncbi:MAG: hypothetical protein IIZ40_01465 [Bacilli bacterium]|nr:hypothetical protein [Bacilli bacterium]
MATSNTFSTSNTYIKYRIIVTENSYSVANNTSNVTVKVQAWRTNQGYETYGTGTCYVNIDGTTYSQSISSSQKITYNSYTQLFSKTLTINHNTDGSKALYVSSYISHSRFDSTSQGFTVNLTNIPRSATITNAPNFNDTQNPTITYSNSAGNEVSSLQACISLSGSNDDIVYRNISKTGTSYTFNLTEAERNVLRQATTTSKSRTVYFYIKTVINGSTFYTNKAVTLSIVNANPTFSASYLDTNSTTTSITNNNQQIIQNNSTLRINITNASALKYASLTSASINVNGVVTTQTLNSSSLTFNVGVLNVSQNLNIPVTITDSRGNSTTQNLTIQVLEWSLPTAIITLERESNFYTETNLNVNADYSNLDSKNEITIQYQIKKTTDASYGALTTIQDNVETQFNADNHYSWNVKVILTDKIGSTTYNLFLYKGIPLMFWDRLLSSVSINCFPTNQYSLALNGIDVMEAIQGTALYSNTTGSAGTITLSDNASNYDKFYIEFIDNDGTVGSKEITSPNGKNIYLSITYPGSVSYKKDVIVSINGTSITPQTYSTITFRSGQSPTINSTTNYIYITKILGFKY